MVFNTQVNDWKKEQKKQADANADAAAAAAENGIELNAATQAAGDDTGKGLAGPPGTADRHAACISPVQIETGK